MAACASIMVKDFKNGREGDLYQKLVTIFLVSKLTTIKN